MLSFSDFIFISLQVSFHPKRKPTMSSIMKVFLLLAAVVCISEAQLAVSSVDSSFPEPGHQCLCQRVRDRLFPRSEMKDIQIYPATIFCDNVEIIVTLNSGLRYCLNPEIKAMKKILTNIMNKQKTTTVRPDEFTSTPSSINAPHI